MKDRTDQPITRNHKNASYKVFREDYRNFAAISYREASDYSGLTVNRLQWLVSQGYLVRAATHGPYRISRENLDAYLRGDFDSAGGQRKQKRRAAAEPCHDRA